MLKSYREAICWLARTKGSVLVITSERARLVDVEHFHGEGLSLQAAHALTNDLGRCCWFDSRRAGDRLLMSLNEAGEMFHRHLVAKKKCTCPRSGHEE